MQLNEFLLRQSDDFNSRIDQLEKLVYECMDKLSRIEYNIIRVEEKLDILYELPAKENANGNE